MREEYWPFGEVLESFWNEESRVEFVSVIIGIVIEGTLIIESRRGKSIREGK